MKTLPREVVQTLMNCTFRLDSSKPTVDCHHWRNRDWSRRRRWSSKVAAHLEATKVLKKCVFFSFIRCTPFEITRGSSTPWVSLWNWPSLSLLSRILNTGLGGFGIFLEDIAMFLHTRLWRTFPIFRTLSFERFGRNPRGNHGNHLRRDPLRSRRL